MADADDDTTDAGDDWAEDDLAGGEADAGERSGGRDAVRIVSADWVVPVEGVPIENGAVAIAADGTIAAVGAAADLGHGERHDGCVIVPGFVNAHSHIEYAVYAGFGDGLPFVPWIGMHVQRKEALDLDDMVAIATVGAHECLRSGITTIGDCSFSGAAATAAAATRPARDRLPRGLRSRRLCARPVPRDPRADRAAARRPGAPGCLAACALHLHARGVPRLRGARAATGDALRRELRRARVARPRHG